MELAIKITNKVFCYQLIGFEKNIIYDTNNRSLILTDANTGAPLKIVEKDQDLDFKVFVSVARNIYLALVEYSN